MILDSSKEMALNGNTTQIIIVSMKITSNDEWQQFYFR